MFSVQVMGAAARIFPVFDDRADPVRFEFLVKSLSH
jgi:hypothetical protein